MGGVEAFGEQRGEVSRDEAGELRRISEAHIRRVIVIAYAGEQAVEASVSVLACLQVDQLRNIRGQVPFVFETGHLFTGGDPPILLPVNPDEDVALLEVGPIQLPGWVRARPSSNITGAIASRSIAARTARRSGASSFSVELTKTRRR